MANSARIDELEKKFSENARRYFAPLANEYRKAGDLDRAIEICRAHLPQQPGHMSGHVVYGQALYESRQLDEAKTVFEAALVLDPENLIALRHLGDIARDNADPATARVWYLRVLDADPRNDEVAAMLGELDAQGPAADVAAAPAATAAPASVGWSDINPERPANAEKADPEPAESPAAALFAEDPAPSPDGSLDRMLNEAFAAEADTLEIEPFAPERGPATGAVADPSSVPRQADLEDETFAEVDALFDELSPPRGTGSQRAVTGSHPAQPSSIRSVPATPASDTGDALFGDDATPDTAGADPGSAVPGLETAEFVSPSREPATRGAGRNTGSMAVTGLTSFDQPTNEDSSTRAAFVTETMAELYLQQGFVAEALEIYRQLLQQNPDDASLQDRVDQLERGGRTSLSVAAVSSKVIEAAQQRHATRPVRTVRSFFGLLAGRRAPHRSAEAERVDGDDFRDATVKESGSEPPVGGDDRGLASPVRLATVSGLFGDVGVSEADEQAASTLSFAFSPAMLGRTERPGGAEADAVPSGGGQAGRAAHTGGSELSLDQVFRESAPRNPRKSGAYSFDQFFSDGTPGGTGVSQAGGATAAESSDGPEADLEQFTAWLEGLKRK